MPVARPQPPSALQFLREAVARALPRARKAPLGPRDPWKRSPATPAARQGQAPEPKNRSFLPAASRRRLYTLPARRVHRQRACAFDGSAPRQQSAHVDTAFSGSAQALLQTQAKLGAWLEREQLSHHAQGDVPIAQGGQ